MRDCYWRTTQPWGFELLNRIAWSTRCHKYELLQRTLAVGGELISWKRRGLGRGEWVSLVTAELELWGLIEQVGSENVLDYLYCVEVGNSDVRYWEELILSAGICFWLIKIRSNESSVEQVLQLLGEWWLCGTKWRTLFCVAQ